MLTHSNKEKSNTNTSSKPLEIAITPQAKSTTKSSPIAVCIRVRPPLKRESEKEIAVTTNMEV